MMKLAQPAGLVVTCRNDPTHAGCAQTMDVSIREQGSYVFGTFRLDPARRTLLRDCAPVTLPPRLFDTLLYLVENAGRVVERDELLRIVWGGRVVEEANINQTIFALRRALQADGPADRYIVTAPTKGYRFVAPVRFELDPTGISSMPPQAAVPVPQPPKPWWRRRSTLFAALLAAAALAGAVLLKSLLSTPKLPESAVQARFAPPPHSVAVLAFINMSGDPGQDYFSDGVSEEMINALSRVDALRVAARTSSFYFKGKQATVSDIARQLNVGAVLEGSVRREAKRVRISAELVNAATGYEMWSRSYDRDQGDMLAVQSEIATAVTASLQVTLLGDAAATFSLGGTTNPLALDAYLRGRAAFRSIDVPDTKLALAAFEQATAIDPNYAMAHLERALALDHIAGLEANTDVAQIQAMFRSALDAADRAIALAPGLGIAHCARAYALEQFPDRAGEASAEYARAIALSPGDARVQLWYADSQMHRSAEPLPVRVAAVERAAALDPMSPEAYRVLSGALFAARRYKESLAADRHVEQLEPIVTTMDTTAIGFDELMLGDPEAARQACAGGRDWLENECLAIAFGALHMPAEAAAQMAKLRVALGDAGAYNYAIIYAQWGQKADAIRWLQTAYRLHDNALPGMKVDPLLDPIRDTPEYKEIERQLNFPP
jgi:TolB-like protein/DNA-binding winged helix-turn-helix (wHTH) protein/tetratricopeptide (TPR) repeat protein